MAFFLLALFHVEAAFAGDSRADSYPPEWTGGKTYCPDGKTKEKGNGFFATTRDSGATRLWDSFKRLEMDLDTLRESSCFPGGVAYAEKTKPVVDSLREDLREGVEASACELQGTTAESRANLARGVPARIQAAEKWLDASLNDDLANQAMALDTPCLKTLGYAVDDLSMSLKNLSCELLITRNRLAYLNEKYDQGRADTYICADDAVPAKPDYSVDDRGIPKSDITGLGTH